MTVKSMKNLAYYMALLTLLLGFVLVGLVAYWLFYPYEVITWKTDTFPVLNTTVYQGENLYFISDYCKYHGLPGTVARSFVDGIVFSTPETTTNRLTGCHKITVVVPIPHELPPGKYYLSTIYTYDVNPIRTIDYKRNTELFTVLEATASGR